jgi:ATP-dependent DNA helicase RecQ
MTAMDASPATDNRTELPGRSEIESARWAFGRIPASIELKWAAALRARGDFDDAQELLDGVRTHHGETAGWIEEAARLAFASNAFDRAEGLLRQRIERYPSATAEVALGRFLLDQSRTSEAEKIAKRLTAAHGELLTVMMFAADVARALGQVDLARGYYLAIVDARGEHPSGLQMMAELSLEDGDDRPAREFLRRVIYAYDEGGYKLTAGAAQRLARLADDLDETATAERYRLWAEGESAKGRAVLAGEIWNALEKAGALKRPDTVPSPGVTDASASEPPASAPGRLRPPSVQPIVVPSPTNERAARADVRIALRELFGHEEFRPGQIDVIEKVLDGEDTLAIIPTGGGKSLTYQLTAMMSDGVTLVVSPLIALMRDQVEKAPEQIRDQVSLINSDIGLDERRERLRLVANGQIKLLYVAPERLLDPTLKRALLAAGIARVVIDEAHCISLWGHDFRPDYLTIPLALREFGDPPLLAVTATATPEMADQIGMALDRNLSLVRTSVFRSNLFYEVLPAEDRNDRIEKMIQVCTQEAGNGIVYVSSRKDAELHAGTLRHRDVHALPYHAGLPRDERAKAQDAFMAGEVRVIVATIAFGMGVDKADVRFIVHMLPPGTVEAYAQESGRAGRDGAPARCVMITTRSDRATLRARTRRDLVEIETLRTVYREVRNRQRSGWSAVDIGALDRRLNDGLDERDRIETRVGLGYLEQAGFIQRTPDAAVRIHVRKQLVQSSPEFDPTWAALLPLLGEDWERYGEAEIDVATVCAALALEPAQLEAFLGDREEIRIERGTRSAWYRMLPVPEDASHVLNHLLADATRRADDRIDQVMGYTEGHTCRHRLLAAALGEAIDPCGASCDVCKPPVGVVKSARPISNARAKRTATIDDARLVLNAIADLPYQVGRRSLVWLFSGSPESRLRREDVPAFGALSGLGPARIERLLDQLIEADFLAFVMKDEYRLVGLTERGSNPTVEDLAALPLDRSSGPARPISLDEEGLYQQLIAWRTRAAFAQKVPTYVVATNKALREVARVKPTSIGQLANLPEFGPKRVEQYGPELLQIVAMYS